jgi:hypothetical protein
MTYQEEMVIAGRVIAATQKLTQATNAEGVSICPFQTLEALAEARDAFEDALEIMNSMHPLREQIMRHIKDTERLHRKLMLEL